MCVSVYVYQYLCVYTCTYVRKIQFPLYHEIVRMAGNFLKIFLCHEYKCSDKIFPWV